MLDGARAHLWSRDAVVLPTIRVPTLVLHVEHEKVVDVRGETAPSLFRSQPMRI
jgi:hypothetical protein